ncbi:MAG TPA: hypothetical protein VFK02_10565 [Kofleriaceae bacterium]|nr:hypothetical protein [Kofleriaceae bacterium]
MRVRAGSRSRSTSRSTSTSPSSSTSWVNLEVIVEANDPFATGDTLWFPASELPSGALGASDTISSRSTGPSPSSGASHGPGRVTARRHFAGDPRLTPSQGRDRWALPALYPSLVAEAGGVPIEAVFVPDGDRWRALIGLDTVVRAHVAALDPACAERLGLAGPTSRCTEVGAEIVMAALRTDREQLAHVCRLAETLCGKGSP